MQCVRLVAAVLFTLAVVAPADAADAHRLTGPFMLTRTKADEPAFVLRGRCGRGSAWATACARTDLITTAAEHRRDRSGIVCVMASSVYTFTGTLDGKRVSVSATFCGGSAASLAALRKFAALVRRAHR
jgi:hypothetical protein